MSTARRLFDALCAIPYEGKGDGVSANEGLIGQALAEIGLSVRPKQHLTDAIDFIVDTEHGTIELEAKSSKSGRPSWNGHQPAESTVFVFSGPGGTTLFMGSDCVDEDELMEFNAIQEQVLREFKQRTAHLKTVKGGLVNRMVYPRVGSPLSHPDRAAREARVLQHFEALL
jgi:hypothetical protein